MDVMVVFMVPFVATCLNLGRSPFMLSVTIERSALVVPAACGLARAGYKGSS